MKKFILFFAILSLLSSCSESPRQSSDAPTLSIFDVSDEVTDLSAYIKDVDIIQFDSESVLVPAIFKLLRYEDKWIINTGSEIVELNSDGSLSKKIGRQGRGPGEYLHITDMCISQDEAELLCLTHQNEIMRYSLSDGRFLGIIDSVVQGISSSAIVPFSKDGFAIFFDHPSDFADKEFYSLKCFDKEGSLIKEDLLWEDFNVVMGFRPFVSQSYDNAYILSYSTSSGPCYIAEGGRVAPLVNMNLGTRGIPKGFALRGDDPWNYLEEMMVDDRFKCPYVCKTKDLYYVNVFGRDSAMWNFITDGKKGIRWESVPETAAPIFFLTADKEAFYFVLQEAELKNSSDALKKALANHIDPGIPVEEYPLLVKVKFSL